MKKLLFNQYDKYDIKDNIIWDLFRDIDDIIMKGIMMKYNNPYYINRTYKYSFAFDYIKSARNIITNDGITKGLECTSLTIRRNRIDRRSAFRTVFTFEVKVIRELKYIHKIEVKRYSKQNKTIIKYDGTAVCSLRLNKLERKLSTDQIEEIKKHLCFIDNGKTLFNENFLRLFILFLTQEIIFHSKLIKCI